MLGSLPIEKLIVFMEHIQKMDIRKQDLGLLMVLDALIAEQSVTGMAKRLHLSQPAASSALRRLREWTNDPLLVRSQGGYVLTTRALELADPVQRILQDIQLTVLQPPPFDPKRADRTFRMTANDAFELAALPALMRRLQIEAPNISLEISPGGPKPDQSALQDGTQDLCCGYFSDVPPELHRRVLMSERLVGIARQGHPRIRSKRPGLRQFAEADFIAIVPQGRAFLSIVKNMIEQQVPNARFPLSLPHVLSAPAVVAQSDLITVTSQRVAANYGRALGLQIFELPIAIPAFDIYAVWHERAHRDPALQWLLSVIGQVCAEVDKTRTAAP